MDKETKEVNTAVRNILNKLVEDFPNYKWESMVVFSDGSGKTILEISIYADLGNKKVGRISYQVETGEILNYSFKGYKEKNMESLVDLLLDIMNLIREQNPS